MRTKTYLDSCRKSESRSRNAIQLGHLPEYRSANRQCSPATTLTPVVCPPVSTLPPLHIPISPLQLLSPSSASPSNLGNVQFLGDDFGGALSYNRNLEQELDDWTRLLIDAEKDKR